MSDIGIATVWPGGEREAQHEIERAGFGTRVLSFRSATFLRGKRYVRLRPLFPGYVVPALGPGWGAINEIEGVMVLTDANGAPRRVSGRDEARLNELERHCLFGDFNKVEARRANGQFSEHKRRRKPRRSKRARDR
jgi:hypothetical protein